MHLEDFPYCCSAEVIVDFGGGHTHERESYTKEEAIKGIKYYLSNSNAKTIFALVTSTQPNAKAALEEIGFYTHPDPSMCATRHKMFPYFIHRKEWNRKEFEARYNPEKDTYVNGKNKGLKFKQEDEYNNLW